MTRRPELFVTGAAGMVGSYVRRVFANHELVLTDITEGSTALDVRDQAAVRSAIGDVRPDAVLHLAAATDVDRCEQEPDWAYDANAIGTRNVALACQAMQRNSRREWEWLAGDRSETGCGQRTPSAPLPPCHRSPRASLVHE